MPLLKEAALISWDFNLFFQVLCFFRLANIPSGRLCRPLLYPSAPDCPPALEAPQGSAVSQVMHSLGMDRLLPFRFAYGCGSLKLIISPLLLLFNVAFILLSANDYKCIKALMN